MTEILVLVEHDRGEISPAATEALTAAKQLGETLSLSPIAVLIGPDTAELGVVSRDYGLSLIHI